MKFGKRERFSKQLENFAITDIVMNLFIFFVITFNLLYIFSEKMEEVGLPESIQKDKTTGILVSITKDNKIYVNELHVTTLNEQDLPILTDDMSDEDKAKELEKAILPITELTEALRRQLGSTPKDERRVIIRGDKTLPYKKIEKVTNSVLDADLSLVSFAIISKE